MKSDAIKSLFGLCAVLVFLIAYTFLFSSCGGGGGSTASTVVSVDENQTEFLKSFSGNVLLPTLQDFAEKAAILKEKLSLLENEITTNGGNGGSFLVNAQQAWEDAMLAWESVEMMQVGPTGVSASTQGGKGLRDEIYSWPTTSACSIDQELVKNAFKTTNYLDSKLINIYGLDAIEYLLFHQDLDNACSIQVDINANATWSGLSENEVYLRRASYAVIVANKISEDADDLLNEWAATGQNFVAKFNDAGVDKTVYATSEKAMNEVYAGLFYLDAKVKDKKLAIPFSLGSESGKALDPEKLEFKYGSTSKKSVIVNLKAFKLIFQGGDSTATFGLDDLLLANNASSTATKILQQINITIDSFEALPEFETIIDSKDTTTISAAYSELKKLTTLIKEELSLALNLQIPKEGAGDND